MTTWLRPWTRRTRTRCRSALQHVPSYIKALPWTARYEIESDLIDNTVDVNCVGSSARLRSISTTGLSEKTKRGELDVSGALTCRHRQVFSMLLTVVHWLLDAAVGALPQKHSIPYSKPK